MLDTASAGEAVTLNESACGLLPAAARFAARGVPLVSRIESGMVIDVPASA